MVFRLVFVVVAAAMGNFSKCVPWFIEKLIGFWPAFDGAWLLAMGPQGHQVSHDCPQQLIAKLLPLGLAGVSPHFLHFWRSRRRKGSPTSVPWMAPSVGGYVQNYFTK
jgi:hypothetical protein